MIDGLMSGDQFKKAAHKYLGVWRNNPGLVAIQDALEEAHAVEGRDEQFKAVLNARGAVMNWLAANHELKVYVPGRRVGGTGSKRMRGVAAVDAEIQTVLDGPYAPEYGRFRAQVQTKVKAAGKRFKKITGIEVIDGRVVAPMGTRTVSSQEYIVEIIEPEHRGKAVMLFEAWKGDAVTTLSFPDWLKTEEGRGLTAGIDALYQTRDGTPKKVRHLGAVERSHYELRFVGGRFYRLMDDNQPFSTAHHRTDPDDANQGWGIFVMSRQNRIYSHSKTVGVFHHSSFLGGEPTKAAGCLCVDRGRIVGVNLASGHYKPGRVQMLNLLRALLGIYQNYSKTNRDRAEKMLNEVRVSNAFQTQGGFPGPYYKGYDYLTKGGNGADPVGAPPIPAP